MAQKLPALYVIIYIRLCVHRECNVTNTTWKQIMLGHKLEENGALILRQCIFLASLVVSEIVQIQREELSQSLYRAC